MTAQLAAVMEEATAGDPMSSVKWSRKSTRAVSRELKVSHTKAWHMLKRAEYRLRTNRKRLARKSSEHREEQFQIIDRLKKSFPLVLLDPASLLQGLAVEDKGKYRPFVD